MSNYQYDKDQRQSSLAENVAVNVAENKALGYLKNTKLAKKLGEQVAKKISKQAIAKTIESLVSTSTGFIAGIAGTPIVIILIVMCLIGIPLFSMMSIFGGDPLEVMDKTALAIKEPYEEEVFSPYVRSAIIEHVNANYDCGASDSDLTRNASGMVVKTRTCKIGVAFSPSYEEVASILTSYANAVNSTITHYKGVSEEELDEDVEQEINKYDTVETEDINDFVVPTDETETIDFSVEGQDISVEVPVYEYGDKVQEDIDNAERDEYNDLTSDRFIETIEELGHDLFETDTNAEVWSVAVEEHEFTYTTTGCYSKANGSVDGEEIYIKVDDNFCSIPELNSEYFTREEEEKVDGYLGTINVPVYYDITKYKQEELEEVIQSLIGNGRCVFEKDADGSLDGTDECIESEARRVVHQTLSSYFITSSSVFVPPDSPYASYMGNYFGGVAGYSGAIGYSLDAPNYEMYGGEYYSFDHPVAQQMWAHADYLHANGLIYGSTTNYFQGCTYFAQMWFYDVWGFNSSAGKSGDGAHFYENVIKAHPDKFELGYSPSAGGVASLSYNHVVCIDYVDYENDIIIISDGNYRAGGVRIRNQMSLSEWMSNNRGAKYANPKQS